MSVVISTSLISVIQDEFPCSIHDHEAVYIPQAAESIIFILLHAFDQPYVQYQIPQSSSINHLAQSGIVILHNLYHVASADIATTPIVFILSISFCISFMNSFEITTSQRSPALKFNAC